MRLGRYYNQDGNEAFGNETRLTLDDLNRYLRNLDSTGNHSNLSQKIYTKWFSNDYIGNSIFIKIKSFSIILKMED